MKDISKEYSLLFNTITDMEEALQTMLNQLVAVQQQAENLFVEDAEEDN